MQYGPMTPLQAVLHDRGAGTDANAVREPAHREPRVVDYLPNPESRSPWQIASQVPGGSAPELPSPDILRLAEFAVARGFRITRFQLVDRRYAMLPEPEQSETSAALVEAFSDGGAYRLQVVMRRDYPNVFLNGVEVYSHPGIRLEVRRGGVLLTNNTQQLEEFFSAAVEALGIS